MAIPKIEAMSAKVIDNNDEKGLNRLVVQFSWQEANNSTTGWIRYVNAHAGAAHGTHILPEINDEVWCVFQGDNPERPLAIGSGYNQTAKSEFHEPNNNIKAIKTKSGNTIISNDEEGSITIKNPSGSVVILQKEGNIMISAPNTMTLNATDINMVAGNSINMIAKPNEQGEGQGVITAMAEKLIDIKAENETISMTSKEDLNLFSTHAATNIAAKTNMNLNGEATVNMDGDALNIIGGSKIKVESSDTDIF